MVYMPRVTYNASWQADAYVLRRNSTYQPIICTLQRYTFVLQENQMEIIIS